MNHVATAVLPSMRRSTGTSTQATSILLLAAGPAAERTAHCLRQEGFTVAVAPEESGCLEALRRETFDLLLIEESICANSPAAEEMFYDMAGPAVLLQINFGIANEQRIAREVRGVLRRRALDEQHATVSASLKLRSELLAALTGLLLESQLALRQAGPECASTLQRLIDLAEHVSDVLQT